MEIRLKPGGSIAGRVLDSPGRPVARAVVLLLHRSYRYRDLVYSPDQAVATDENGEYRLEHVAAEQGLLVLVKKPLQAAAPDQVPPYDTRERVLLPAFYGNSTAISGAQTVILASGEHPGACGHPYAGRAVLLHRGIGGRCGHGEAGLRQFYRAPVLRFRLVAGTRHRQGECARDVSRLRLACGGVSDDGYQRTTR